MHLATKSHVTYVHKETTSSTFLPRKASGLCVVHGAGGMGKTVATCASIQHEESLWPG